MRTVQRNWRTSRGGFTLAEMLVAISVLFVVSVTSALTIGMLMAADARSGEAFLVQNSLVRLGRQFRDDVHAARAVSVAAEDGVPDGRMVLELSDGGGVTYRAAADGVVREAAGTADGDAREEFRLPEGSSRFSVIDNGRLAVLIHERPYLTHTDSYARGSDSVPMREVRFEAATGWSVRDFVEGNGDEGE